MIQVSGSLAPPPRGEGWVGFLTQIDDFSKESLLRSSSREIPLWRKPGGWTPYSKYIFLKGSVCHIVS